MTNFKREEVIELAERIFVELLPCKPTRDKIEVIARQAIRTAMVFREEERDIF